VPEEAHKIQGTGDGIPVRLGPAREGLGAQHFDTRDIPFLLRASQDQPESGRNAKEGRGLSRIGVQLGLLNRDHIGGHQVTQVRAELAISHRLPC